MKYNNMGFTLIELLIVVLIIGILAAVAVPQYQKAVEKSRAVQALTLLKSLIQAQEAYYLANGEYADQFEKLDVEMNAWTGNTKWSNYSGSEDTRSNGEWSLQLDGHGKYLMLGRINGIYAGGGFVVDMETKDILCAERNHGKGFIYGQESGSYCEKIFQAKPVNLSFSTLRPYTLPY